MSLNDVSLNDVYDVRRDEKKPLSNVRREKDGKKTGKRREKV